ncbi:Intraflagellar transport protein 52 [Phlyctochytrium bullatum]|nr:Intraflagellar transport protein 52 [Phlyctochytrium bullatum]
MDSARGYGSGYQKASSSITSAASGVPGARAGGGSTAAGGAGAGAGGVPAKLKSGPTASGTTERGYDGGGSGSLYDRGGAGGLGSTASGRGLAGGLDASVASIRTGAMSSSRTAAEGGGAAGSRAGMGSGGHRVPMGMGMGGASSITSKNNLSSTSSFNMTSTDTLGVANLFQTSTSSVALASTGAGRLSSTSGLSQQISSIRAAAAAAASTGNAAPLVVLFNISKKEAFTPSNGFRSMQRRLRGDFKIGLSKDDISASRFTDTSLLVFGCPREKFSHSEFEALKTYLDRGGSILYLASEGGESANATNFNFLLEEYGIMVNSDCVVRTVFHKYFHPKESFVSNGVVNREINKAAGKIVSTLGSPTRQTMGNVNYHSMHRNSNCLTFVYPFGATLNVQKPGVPILSSGTMSYPLNRPIGAAYIHPDGHGKIVVLGSAEMFSDKYLEKEENAKVFDAIIKLLTTDSIQLNAIDASDPDISDYHYVPDTIKLSETVRSALLESEEVPKDFSTMFDFKLFQFDTSLVPAAINFYHETRLKRESLSLIQPQFETPLPPLDPAVFPPTIRELPPPALDLFDLDEQFASERIQLARLTNKCDDDDLEYYIRECAVILGITDKLDPERRTARDILYFVMKNLVQWKMLNPFENNPVPSASNASASLDAATSSLKTKAGPLEKHKNKQSDVESPDLRSPFTKMFV